MKIDPKYAFLHAFFLIYPSCPFQNVSIWPKTHPFFFPILHVFAPLNDVRAYIAWSWKTTLITWIFGRALYPLDHRLIKTQIGHARDFAWYRGQRPSPARLILSHESVQIHARENLCSYATNPPHFGVRELLLCDIFITRAGDGPWPRYQAKSLACPGCALDIRVPPPGFFSHTWGTRFKYLLKLCPYILIYSALHIGPNAVVLSHFRCVHPEN